MRYFLNLIFIGFYSFTTAQGYLPVDEASKVSFKIKNFGSSVDGNFKGLKGTIDFNPSDVINARFDVTLSTATIDTGIGMRDNHLCKPDYFGVADFPLIRFVSTKVVASGKTSEAIITGKLTIKKITKEISFPFRYSEANGMLQFTGEFQINRRDFNVGGSSISLADELKVMIDVKTSK